MMKAIFAPTVVSTDVFCCCHLFNCITSELFGKAEEGCMIISGMDRLQNLSNIVQLMLDHYCRNKN